MRTWVPMIVGVLALIAAFVVMELLFPQGCSLKKSVQKEGDKPVTTQPVLETSDKE